MSQSQPQAAVLSMKDVVDDATVDESTPRLDALSQENVALHQVAEYQSMAISRVAHELRTPLTSILGFAEILLSQEQLTEAQRNFCERIQNSAQQLQGSLNQLADLSRLELGKSDLREQEFAIEDVLREASRTIAAEARKKGVKIEMQAASNLPLIVSNRGKLRQTLSMVLDYAIARGKSDATIDTTAEIIDGRFVVKIENELSSNDFEPLARPSRRAGLGLAIATHNLKSLGATVNLTDRDSKHLEIVITLPIQPSAPPI